MKIIIRGEDYQVSNSDRRMIQTKLKRLEKILPELNEEIKTAGVKIKKDSRWGLIVSFNMWLPEKEHIYTEVKGEKLRLIITEIRDQTERQIKKYKAKIKS